MTITLTLIFSIKLSDFREEQKPKIFQNKVAPSWGQPLPCFRLVWDKVDTNFGSKKFVELIFATPNSTQPKVGYALFSDAKPQPHQNRPSLFLSSYTTKLDQIQCATLFLPN